MDTDHHILFTGHISLYQGNMAEIIQIVFIGNDLKCPEFGRKVRFSHPVHHLFMLFTISYKRSYRNENKLMLSGKFYELWRTHHVSVFIHDFTTDTYRRQPSQAA